MFQRRETGSILLPAPRERVFELLRDAVDPDGQARTTGDERLVLQHRHGGASTFVLRDEPGGRTRLIGARTAAPGLPSLFTHETRLREAVEADLFRVQRLVDADRRL